MNSYIIKYEFIYPVTYEFIHPYEFIYPVTYEFIHTYEFIYPVTYEFIHPAKCMNSYVSDPCLVYKKMVTEGGGGVVLIGPGFESPKPGYIFF